MYDNYFKQTEKSWINREVFSKENTIQIGYDYPQKDGYDLDMYLYRSRSGGAVFCGVATGQWTSHNGVNYLQVMGNFGLYGSGYVAAGDIDQTRGKIVPQTKDKEAQNLVNSLIYNNKVLAENNLLAAGMMQKIVQAGKTVPQSYYNALAGLQDNLETRNKRLLNSPYFKTVSQSTPTGFNKYSAVLKEITNNPENPSIGIAPVLIYVVASVIITALVGWIVYLIFKPDYTDSKADLKISSDLMRALDTLDPETKAKVIADLEGQVDKAYVQGKISGSGKVYRNIGLLAAGVGLFFAAKPALERVGITDKKESK